MNPNNMQRPMMNKGMYPGYMGQQQNSPYMQQQQPGMNPQLRGMMPRYPNPSGMKRPASSAFGQNVMGNGPPVPQQPQQNPPSNFPPFPSQVKQEPNFPPQYPVSCPVLILINFFYLVKILGCCHNFRVCIFNGL